MAPTERTEEGTSEEVQRSRRRAWWRPTSLYHAVRSGNRPEDKRTRKKIASGALGATKLGAIGLVAVILARGIVSALNAQPAQFAAAIEGEAGERRTQHQEAREDAQAIVRSVDKVTATVAGQQESITWMQGNVSGKLNCPPPRPCVCPAPIVTVPVTVIGVKTVEPPPKATLMPGTKK